MRPGKPGWTEAADRAWQALHLLRATAREEGVALRVVGLSWDFPRDQHGLYVIPQERAQDLTALPAEVLGLRVKVRSPRGV